MLSREEGTIALIEASRAPTASRSGALVAQSSSLIAKSKADNREYCTKVYDTSIPVGGFGHCAIRWKHRAYQWRNAHACTVTPHHELPSALPPSSQGAHCKVGRLLRCSRLKFQDLVSARKEGSTYSASHAFALLVTASHQPRS